MKINLSCYAGFCDGVDRAYKIVEKSVKNKKTQKPIYMLGSLVHNESVVAKIEKMGVRKIVLEKSVKNTLEKIKGKIGTIVVTAHGFGPALYEYAQKNDINILDTTCPRVFKVQRLAKAFAGRGAQVIILGEKNHKEVKGIFEWSGKKAQIIEGEKDLEKLKLDRKKEVVLVSQTTQNEVLFLKIAQIMKKKFRAKIFNTVCDTTHNRQEEVKKMAKENEVMIVIGSEHSSNSNRLNEISREINPRTYFVEKAQKIPKAWLQNVKKVGVTAGASTPKWIIAEVIKKLKSF